MYKKLTVSFLVFQFILTLIGQLLYLHYTVAFAEESFGLQAQRYFDGVGEAPAFCEDDGRFSTLRARVSVGGRWLWVTGKSGALSEWAAEILPLFSVWMVASLLSACLFSGGVYTALHRPLFAITQGMTAWQGEGNLPEITVYGQDELGQVGKSIAESLGRAEEKRRLSAGRMRHELLNPLAALRGAAEGIWEETGSGLAHILMEESDRMEELVLEETGGQTKRNVRMICDLQHLCRSCISLCRGMSRRAGRETVFFVSPLSSAGAGDERAWRAAVLNLQQNALRYSPRESKTVFCAFEKRGYAVFLLFNRAAGKNKGEGRGLSYVENICRENGGYFRSGRVKNGGYAAFLAIPVL